MRYRHGEGVVEPQRTYCRRCPRWAKDTRPPDFLANEPNGGRRRGRYHVPANSEIRERGEPRWGITAATDQRCARRLAILLFRGRTNRRKEGTCAERR